MSVRVKGQSGTCFFYSVSGEKGIVCVRVKGHLVCCGRGKYIYKMKTCSMSCILNYVVSVNRAHMQVNANQSCHNVFRCFNW